MVSESILEEKEKGSHVEENLRVYSRRRKGTQAQPLSGGNDITHNEQQLEIVEQQESLVADDEADRVLETGGEEVDTSMDLPIAVRKGLRITAGKPPTRYGFENGNDDDDDENNIARQSKLCLI